MSSEYLRTLTHRTGPLRKKAREATTAMVSAALADNTKENNLCNIWQAYNEALLALSDLRDKCVAYLEENNDGRLPRT